MVNVFAFFSNDPSLNIAEVYNFSVKIVYERTKINKIEACVGPFVKHSVAANLVLRCFGKVDILLFEYFEQIT